jgi:hypothetical protein
VKAVLEESASNQFLGVIGANSKLGRRLFDRETRDEFAQDQEFEGRLGVALDIDDAQVRDAE